MPLGAPSIVGPVSNCSDRVQVQGQFSGSRVRIFIVGDPKPIADKLVEWSDVVISIDRSRLVKDQKLVATQDIKGEQSKLQDAAPVNVDEAVNGQVQFAVTNEPPYDKPPNVCGRSVFLRDCSPGSILTVLQSGTVLGKTTAFGQLAQIDFLPGEVIAGGIPLTVTQTICTSSVPVVTSSNIPVAPPAGPSGKLPMPEIERPVQACRGLVTIRNIVPGAIVRLFRGRKIIFEGSCPLDVERVVVEPLAEHEVLAVEQLMPDCKSRNLIQPSDPDRLVVGPLGPLVRPRIDGPLCAGHGWVTVSRLAEGATVRVLADGVEIGRWEAWKDSCQFHVKVSEPPTKITVKQELCGLGSLSRGYLAATSKSGRWFVVEDANGDDLLANAFAIHAALVRTGEIVLFSGNQFYEDQVGTKRNPPSLTSIDHTEVFNCNALTIRKAGSPHFDTFCSGHALLSDGRLLVAGGTEMWELPKAGKDVHRTHFPGLADAAVFDPVATGAPWSNVGPMLGGGRWYPTAVTLANGRVLLLSGHPANSEPKEPDGSTRHNNHTMVLYRPSASSPWHDLGKSDQILSSDDGHLYPRLHVLPGGDVFSSTTVKSGASARWTPDGGTIWRDVAPAPAGSGYGGINLTSVLLPLLPEDNYRACVMVCGEGEGQIIDFGTFSSPHPKPSWRAIGPRSASANNRLRLNLNAVILPSAEVLVCGGVEDDTDDSTAVDEPEMLVRKSTSDPEVFPWKWSQAEYAPARLARNYHSVALLMPDGRVWTAGSSIDARSGDDTHRRREIEIYEPWYCCHDRPVIRNWPTILKAGMRLQAQVKSNVPITRLAIVRCGSSTHAFNGDQRYVGLGSLTTHGDLYSGIVPGRDIAIPGYYLLFAVNKANVPSEGKFVRMR